jgi:uncharacterized membrane protein YdfJ with MMPL/SSD domain
VAGPATPSRPPRCSSSATSGPSRRGHSTALVGGSGAALIDTLAGLGGSLPWAMLWIAVSTFVLLFLFTGSVVLPAKALAPTPCR